MCMYFPLQDFNRTIGRFYQSVFVPNSTLALTGTSEGHGIVWENEGRWGIIDCIVMYWASGAKSVCKNNY